MPSELEFVFGETASVFHKTKVLAREMIAENTLALTIERPEGFTFEPGQNTTISIPGKHAEDLREFTIASAPHDKDILIAMRVRGTNFKNACYALQPGDAVSLRTAAGSLWQSTSRPQIWLSGGIGVTPFRSIIRHLLHTKAPLDITHLHSDRTRSSAPFIEELEGYAHTHSGYEFLPIITSESGRINEAIIREHSKGDCECFVVGTDSFVSSMRGMIARLKEAQDIHIEKFDGYRS